MSGIVEAIDSKVGEVRTESLDLSIGEIISLHENKELVIQPDFQRLFRWSNQQRSRLVESVLLELPIPSIFVIEREDGVLELIDGLQRTSTLIQFVNASAISLDPLVLEGCDLVKELNGATFESLPLTLRLRLKRTGVRTVVIKRQSSQFLRYEMFKRLNSGGSKLSEQDVRNVNARMLGQKGTDFYQFLIQCSENANFTTTTELLSATSIEARAREELVLRFLALKNYRDGYSGSIVDWLNEYMDSVLLSDTEFDYVKEQGAFDSLFAELAVKFGQYAFVKYRAGKPIGGLAPAYFEAVAMGSLSAIVSLRALTTEEATKRLAALVESEDFRAVTGPGANSKPKLARRIELVATALS